MSSFSYRLGQRTARHARAVVGSWLLVLVVGRRHGRRLRRRAPGRPDDPRHRVAGRASTSSRRGSPRWRARRGRSCSSPRRAGGSRRTAARSAAADRARGTSTTCCSPRTRSARGTSSCRVLRGRPARAGPGAARHPVRAGWTGPRRGHRGDRERRTSGPAGGRADRRRPRRPDVHRAHRARVGHRGHRLGVALVVLVLTLGSLLGGGDPVADRRARASASRWPGVVTSASFFSINTSTPVAGDDDRPGCRHRLRAVPRRPAPRPAPRRHGRRRSPWPARSPPPGAR